MELAEQLRNAWTADNHFPGEWHGRLSEDEAYRVQLANLEHALSIGGVQAGWKIGLTGDAVRNRYNATRPVFGFLLEKGGVRSGHTFRWDKLLQPGLEAEMLVILGQDLAGPGVTVEQARAAVAQVAPAFEIIERRGGDFGTDFNLGLADNVSHRAFVTGTPVPFPEELDAGDVEVDVRRNGKSEVKALGREVMDDPIHSLVWLANTLRDYGAELKAGQCVLTGTFVKPLAVQQGDEVEAVFTHLGSVRATFG